MKGKLSSVVILCLLLAQSAVTYAQQPLRFKQLSDKNGLSSNQVTCFAQNANGLVWIGTANGLNAWDGFRFRKFFRSAWDSTSIADSYIQCLLSDHNNHVWAGGRGSVSLLRHGAVKFEVHKLPNSKRVYALYEDAQNRIWAGSDNGLYLLNSSTNTFERVFDQPVYDIDFKDVFLTLTSRSAILGFDPAKNKIIGNYTEQFTGLGGMLYQPSSITFDHDRLFITNSVSGFYEANIRTEVYTHIDPFGRQLFNPVCHQADSTGAIWIGCTKGLYVYQPADSSLKKANEFSQTDEPLLEHQYIRCLFFDQSGLLWAGTRDQGIFIAGTLKNAFLPYQLPAFKNTRITAIRSTANDVLVGTETNGLISWTYPSNATTQQTRLPATKVNCIAGTNDPGLFWIGTDKGLFAWDRTNNTFTLHKLYTDTLSQEITALAEMKDANVWIGTSFGMILYVPSTKDVFIYAHKEKDPHSISKGRVNVIYRDKHDRIWAGTQTGLDLYTPATRNFEHYTSALNVIEPDISSITENKNGHLLISAADAGFISLNPQNRKANTLLPDVFCQSALTDGNTTAWLGTIGGLIKINEAGQVRNFSVHNGLPALEHIAGAACWLPDHHAAFGTSTGLYVLNAAYKTPAGSKFNFILSNILLDGKPGAWKNGTLELKPETKYITLQFGSNDYADPAAHHMQYKVEGIDNEWKNCAEGEVHLSNLDEGSYKLMVAGLKDGNVVNEQTLLTIDVVPPFWKSFAFRILMAVLVAGIIWWSVAAYVKRMKQVEAEKHELEKSALQLELDAYKSQVDPVYYDHVIVAVQECINKNDLPGARNYLSKLSSLNSCLTECAEKEFISVDQLWKVLEYTLSIEKLRLGGLLDYRIEISNQVDIHQTLVPNMIVQPFVEKAVTMGLKQKVSDRLLIIKFEPWSKKHILCSIQDNGIGRKAASKSKAGKINFHKTSGSQVARERIHILEHMRNMETRLEIIDLHSDSGDATGTKVILHLPIEK